MTKTNNKEIIKSYMHELWDNRNFDVIAKTFTDDTIIHSPFKLTKGAEEMRLIVERWLEIFPDLHCHYDDFVAEDDVVVSRWHATGTYVGDFFETTPSHQEVCYSGVTTYKLHEDKVIEYWALVDLYGINKQLEGSHD